MYDDAGSVEASFAVTGLPPQTVVHLAAKYDQKAVLFPQRGMLYITGPNAGRWVRRAGEVSVNGPEEAYYTLFRNADGTYTKLAVPLNEDDLLEPAVDDDLAAFTRRWAAPAGTTSSRHPRSPRHPSQKPGLAPGAGGRRHRHARRPPVGRQGVVAR